jgi:general secretion pathway protein D
MGGGYGASQYGNQYGGNMYGQNQAASPFGGQNGVPTVANSTGTGAGATGQYLGASGSAASGGPLPPGIPNVIPNPFDNTLLVKGSPQDIEQIKTLLAQLDLAPRQVLIEAKIYEVDLDNEFAEGLESYVQKNGTNAATGVAGNSNTTTTSNGSAASTISGLSPSTVLTAAAGPGGLALTAGALILKNTQLLGLLNMQESRGKSKVISAPSIIATDSIPATMNIGTQVPVLSSQGLSAGVQSGGSSVFANTVTNESSGVTLAIMARVNSSGVVTMIINQQVSAPIAPSASSAIQSPSFSNRSVSTQVTVADGEPIAIGGAITENHTESSSGIPLLHRIPLLGGLFGAKNYSTQRTELIIFLTPHVIYDTNQITEATEEIRSNLKRVGKLMKNDQ